MTKLILARHGSTTANEAHIIQGWKDYPLSETGKVQVEKLAERLKKEEFDVVISSDLGRAKTTAEVIIAKNGFKGELILDQKLREKTNGVMDGKPEDEYIGKKELGMLDKYNYRYPQGESMRDIHLRVKRRLKKILVEQRGKTILIVSHELVMRLIIMELLRQDFEECLKPRMRNTCISKFIIQPGSGDYGNVITELLNDASHLDDVE